MFIEPCADADELIQRSPDAEVLMGLEPDRIFIERTMLDETWNHS